MLSFVYSFSLPLADYAFPLVATPQVVGLIRVIQGISAETDVGIDRCVSFSHPSYGPTICHSTAPPTPPFHPRCFAELATDTIALDKSCDKLALLSAAPRGIPIWSPIFPGREEPQIPIRSTLDGVI